MLDQALSLIKHACRANLNKRLMKESVYPMHEFFWDSNLPVSLNELIVPYPMRTRAQNLM